jgi:hypothetical protein
MEKGTKIEILVPESEVIVEMSFQRDYSKGISKNNSKYLKCKFSKLFSAPPPQKIPDTFPAAVSCAMYSLFQITP